MRRSNIRVISWLVLALLGAPVAMHLVIHDLHGHHQPVPHGSTAAESDHGNHEHPVIATSSAAPVLMPTLLALPFADSLRSTRPPTVVRSYRNVLTLGALRIDDDVGLQSLFSTFLI